MLSTSRYQVRLFLSFFLPTFCSSLSLLSSNRPTMYQVHFFFFLTVALDADHPTRTLTRTRTLWGDLCLDAVACEGSSLIRPKGDAVDGGCVFQNSRTRVCIYHFRILEPFHHSMYSLVVYAGVALKTLPRAPPTAIVGKKMFLVSFRTSSCVHHVQITC